jgi:hypothetical protein
MCVCMFKMNSYNPLTDSNQIWCSDYSEPGDKHTPLILSFYLESRATPGISDSYAIKLSSTLGHSTDKYSHNTWDAVRPYV